MTEPESKIRVILADDHPSVRAGIRQFIERDPDIDVLGEANDGAEAIELVERHKPDVLLLDLQMPRLSGLEVIGRLHSERSTVRVIVLTAYDDAPYVFAALRAGARGYLLKTAGPDELARAIHSVHAGHSALDASVTRHVVDQFSGSGVREEEPVERLSARELEVLKYAAQGLTNRAIGLRLGITDRTVHSHLINIFAKLGVSTRTEAALKAVRLGWLSLEETAGG